MEVKYDVKTTAVGKFVQQFLDNNSSFVIMNEGIRPNLAEQVKLLPCVQLRRRQDI